MELAAEVMASQAFISSSLWERVTGKQVKLFRKCLLPSRHAATDGLFSSFPDDPHRNFPRQQLKYQQELGTGWFGQVGLCSAT